jgi:hypothetical protein
MPKRKRCGPGRKRVTGIAIGDDPLSTVKRQPATSIIDLR